MEGKDEMKQFPMHAAARTTSNRHLRLYRPSARGGAMATIGILVVAAGVAILLGLAAVTASPVVVAMAAAAVIGPMLLWQPIWVTWALLVGGLMFAGLMPLFVPGVGSKAVWAISLLGFLLMALAIVRALTSRAARAGTPAFVWVLLAFVAYSVLNAAVQGAELYETASGFKRYFQGFGLMFGLAWLGFPSREFERWRKVVVVVLAVQLPFAAYELVHFVPMREAVRTLYPGMVPVDVVAGTFGAGLYGGGASSAMAAFLVVILGFLIAFRREGVLSTRGLWLLVPFVLSPLFLTETKIVVVLVPIVFVALFWRQIIKRPIWGLTGLVAGGLLTITAALAYIYMLPGTPEDRIAKTLAYNFGDHGYGNYVLNRTTALTFWAKQQTVADPVSTVMGHGLGTAHEPTGGSMVRRFPGYGIGLTTVSALLWEQGLFGTLLYLTAWWLALRAALRLRRSAADPIERAELSGMVPGLLVLGVYFFYADLALESLPYQFFTAALLGRLAWLCKSRCADADISHQA